MVSENGGVGGLMTDFMMMPSPAEVPPPSAVSGSDGGPGAAARSQKQKQIQNWQKNRAEAPVRRPPRACTARTPSRLAPPAPSVERAIPRKQSSHYHRGSSNGDAPDPPHTPMPLTSPPSPSRMPLWLLRSMWELASIVHFFNLFRPVLKLKSEFTIEDLEDALLTPNSLLEEIHIVLLKAIPPISRIPLNRDTWVASLCKKLKERWRSLAEDSFPLATVQSHNRDELASYMELSPDRRVIILRALCEARADQDDVRAFIDEMLKQGASLSLIRRERTGIDMQGSTYWYENDPIAGQRLYRELRKSDKDKTKLRGRLMPPPSTSQWETVAINLDEFQSVAEKLSSSRNRMEIAIGKRINNDIMPELKDLQKKRERALKKQQRQAVLLNSYFNAEDLTGGRSRRERKPVTYTFDDYDKSISEAIKITKRRYSSPEQLIIDGKISNGTIEQQSDEEENLNPSDDQLASRTAGHIKLSGTKKRSKLTELPSSQSSESYFSGDEEYGRGKRHRKPQRYAEDAFVNGVSESESEGSGEDDIEGEAVYGDNYGKKKRQVSDSSEDGDDEYKGEEEEDDEEEEDEDDDDEDDEEEDGEEEDFGGSSDDGKYGRKNRYLKYTGTGRGRKRVKDLDKGEVRRSQRATRSHVNYSKYEDSDMEDDDDMEDSDVPETADSDERIDSRENVDHNVKELNRTNVPGDSNDVPIEPESKKTRYPHDKNDNLSSKESVSSSAHGTMNRVEHESCEDMNPRSKLHRFLDLNVAAPAGGGQDDSQLSSLLY